VINPFFSASSNIEIAGLHHSTPKKDTEISLIPQANITLMNYINHGFMLFMYRHLYRHQMVLLLSHDCAPQELGMDDMLQFCQHDREKFVSHEI